ncbi:MAG: HNH endonuclease [Bacteroidetes bacterium]|nr:HNH endonuclease [Bacteroidota bacterium]
MSYIPTQLRQLVVARANHRCEYCGLSQQGQAATFHIDHVVPLAAGGPTTADNLALACVSCSLYKAARQRAVDPESGQPVPMYHPRQNEWHEHFYWVDTHIRGKTATGRAMLEALRMNRSVMLAIRAEEALLGRHSPPQSE